MKKVYLIHWAWIITAICFVNLFINYSVRLGYSVVLPEMIRDLGFNRTAGGSIFNAYLFSYILLTPFTGYLTDKYGGRLVIAICAFILGTGVILMGTVKELWEACVFYAIVGLGATGMWTPIITLVQRWFVINRRGMALGILSTGYGLGFAFMGIGFPWIVYHLNWRYSWYFLGISALFMVTINAIFLRSSPEAKGCLPWGQNEPISSINSKNKRNAPKINLSAIFKEKTFWLIGLSYTCISYSLYGITTFMVDYAKYQLVLPLGKASFLATIHGICQIIGVVTILPLSDYLGRRRTIIISNSFITASLLGIIFASHSWIIFYFLIGVMAIFYGATFPIYGACAGDYFKKEVMGTVIGTWTLFYGSGAILVHWVTGILRDTTGSYDQAFIIDSAMAALAVFLIATVKNSRN
jgi:sugar phosphate permease